jgi:hypothetical protein
MLRGIAFVVALAWAGAASAACPGFHDKSDPIHVTDRELGRALAAEVRAGGTVLLGQCPNLPGTGNIPFEPTATIFYVADRRGRALEFAASGPCDPVLLVRSPTGKWFFDDDNGGERNARLRIFGPAQGRYQIWVGSNGGSACAATLTLRSVRGDAKATRLAQRRAEPGRI